MSTTPKEIEHEILYGLTLHLVVISKQIWKLFPESDKKALSATS